MKIFISSLRIVAGLVCAGDFAASGLQAATYSASGSFFSASWPWYAPSQVTFVELAYSASINDNLTTGPAGAVTLAPVILGQPLAGTVEWIAYPTNGPFADSAFNINTVLYSAVGGDWATYSGQIDLEIGFYLSPYVFTHRTIVSVRPGAT